MSWFDWLTIVVVGLSVVIGLWHGFVREILALVGWIAAAICAALFAPAVASALPDVVPGPGLRLVIALVGVFLGVRIAIGIVAALLAKLVRAAGLGLGDRFFGGAFGAVRGVALMVIAVLVAGFTRIPEDDGWRASKFAGPLETLAIAAKSYLPQGLAERVQYPRRIDTAGQG